MIYSLSTADPRRGFYPHIFVPGDMGRMELALRAAIFACQRQNLDVDAERGAVLVLRLYRMGLTDPEKLAIVVARLMSGPPSAQ